MELAQDFYEKWRNKADKCTAFIVHYFIMKLVSLKTNPNFKEWKSLGNSLDLEENYSLECLAVFLIFLFLSLFQLKH